MKTYKVKAILTAEVEQDIEAKSEEEAVSLFAGQTVEEMLANGADISVDRIEDQAAELVAGVFKGKTASIDYDIDYEHVASQVEERFPNIEFDSEEFDKKVETETERIRKSLPQVLEFEIYADSLEDLDDQVADWVAEETGWLINGCDYEVDSVE